MVLEKNKLIRNFENSKYYGYMFFISYDGKLFDSFDENPGEKSIKGEFKKLLEKNEIQIYKGIQQAGRTDAKVNALSNILYINSKNNIVFNNLKYLEILGLKIIGMSKTLPYLEFPNMIEKRYYIYEYPLEKIKNSEEEIRKNCENLSGEMNYKKYTSQKGKLLKNHIRKINIKYENNKLYFEGDGFLPQQVRIMSNVILNNKYEALEGEYLTLEKIKINTELESCIFKEVKELKIEGVNKIEKNDYFYIFYVDKNKKGEFIGKKGKNIKRLKKIFGNINIVVKEEI